MKDICLTENELLLANPKMASEFSVGENFISKACVEHVTRRQFCPNTCINRIISPMSHENKNDLQDYSSSEKEKRPKKRKK
jgi:hypothetical protein